MSLLSRPLLVHRTLPIGPSRRREDSREGPGAGEARRARQAGGQHRGDPVTVAPTSRPWSGGDPQCARGPDRVRARPDHAGSPRGRDRVRPQGAGHAVRQVGKVYRDKCPKAAESVGKAPERPLVFYDLPKRCYCRMRPINVVESLSVTACRCTRQIRDRNSPGSVAGTVRKPALVASGANRHRLHGPRHIAQTPTAVPLKDGVRREGECAQVA